MIPKSKAPRMVPRGWGHLIRHMIFKLDQINPDYTLTKIVVKHGGLRVYAEGLDGVQWKQVRATERHSLTLCEDCGAPGKSSVLGGIVHTHCSDHLRMWVRESVG